MKKFLNIVGSVAIAATLLSSCTSYNRSMKEPNVRVNLTKSDFSLSDQVSADASTTKVFGIDFNRLFTQKTGKIEGGAAAAALPIPDITSIPVIGTLLGEQTANYALWNMMEANPGYDVVIYPQYETTVSKPILGLGFLSTITKVKATARLGKLNK